MRLTDDLTGRRAIFAKGGLFLLLGLLASAGLLAQSPTLETAALLAIALWAFCRWYYFMFYVVERYVDKTYRFAGLTSFLRYLWKARGVKPRPTSLKGALRPGPKRGRPPVGPRLGARSLGRRRIAWGGSAP